MIQAIILLWLSGSIAEQEYVARLACDMAGARYQIAFGGEEKFEELYADGSTINYADIQELDVVRDANGDIVYSTRINKK